MATRGIYIIDGLVIYNHWDNYPDGAAKFFYDALSSPNKKGGFLAQFIRTCAEAEPQPKDNARKSPDRLMKSWGAEYLYEVTDDGQQIKAYSNPLADWGNVRMIESCEMRQFIELNRESITDNQCEKLFASIPTEYNGSSTTITREYALLYFKQPKEGDSVGAPNSNFAYLCGRIRALQKGERPLSQTEKVIKRLEAIMNAFDLGAAKETVSFRGCAHQYRELLKNEITSLR